MPDDPMLHTAAMIYASDTTILDSIITTHGLSWGWDRIFAVTVNHSVWFHRQVDFADWCCIRRLPRQRRIRAGSAWAISSTGPVKWWPRLRRRASSNISARRNADAPNRSGRGVSVMLNLFSTD